MPRQSRRPPDPPPGDTDESLNLAFPERSWEAKANAYLSKHPVFRSEEFVENYVATGHTRRAAALALQYYVRQRRLVSVRRHLYMVDGASVDPVLLASRLAPHAVVAYGTALWFHGLSIGEDTCTVLARSTAPEFEHHGISYRVVQPPAALQRARAESEQVYRYERERLPLRVTSPERTFVDCLDRLGLGPGLDGVIEAFNGCRLELDPNLLARHAERLENRVCAARVGLMLQTHRHYRTSREAMRRLHVLRPTSPTYAVPGDRDCFFVARWNIMIPKKTWRRMNATCAPGWHERREPAR